MLDVGDSFPHFILPDENGEIFDSKYLEGIRYIVYFYPKDNTSGCTKEAKKMMYGKEVEGTIRSTFIIGKDGKVEACWYKVKVDGHADMVYSTVKSLMQ